MYDVVLVRMIHTYKHAHIIYVNIHMYFNWIECLLKLEIITDSVKMRVLIIFQKQIQIAGK